MHVASISYKPADVLCFCPAVKTDGNSASRRRRLLYRSTTNNGVLFSGTKKVVVYRCSAKDWSNLLILNEIATSLDDNRQAPFKIAHMTEEESEMPPPEEGHVDTEKETQETMAGSRTKLVACALGIFVCYFYYGILQESITKGKYGEGENVEKFTYTLSLVFIQCVLNTLFSKCALTLAVKENDTVPLKLYALCSMSYLGAMLSSNHALQHVGYPTQVLGKSAKPIPVMILGIVFARKRYPHAKFLFILMIVIGVAMFLYKDSAASAKGGETSMFGVGELLLLVSLTLDGVTGACQDRMRGDYLTGAYSMMFAMNACSVLWSALGLLGTGEVFLFVMFVKRFPKVLINMVLFGITSAIGQICIFITVTSFGPLTCSIITTTRKFFTILASVIFFQNPMNMRQWTGTGLVFAGLSLDSVYGKEKKIKK
ncbi:hypothetical protein ScPMuIL_012822 [Solemya velum]